jgi:hypothetical protein
LGNRLGPEASGEGWRRNHMGEGHKAKAEIRNTPASPSEDLVRGPQGRRWWGESLGIKARVSPKYWTSPSGGPTGRYAFGWFRQINGPSLSGPIRAHTREGHNVPSIMSLSWG